MEPLTRTCVLLQPSWTTWQFEDRFQGRLYRGYGKPLKCRAFTASVEQALLAVAWLELSSMGTALELGMPPLLVPLACLIPQSSLWDDGQVMLFRAILALTQKTFGKPNGI